jgi:hypothetical protein
MRALTIIEVLLFIIIITTFTWIFIIVLNQFKVVSGIRNTQRWRDSNTLVIATYEYLLSNKGQIPEGVTEEPKEICKMDANDCSGYIDLSMLVSDDGYLSNIPEDPKNTSGNGTGYLISINQNRRIEVRAIYAELDQEIYVIR